MCFLCLHCVFVLLRLCAPISSMCKYNIAAPWQNAVDSGIRAAEVHKYLKQSMLAQKSHSLFQTSPDGTHSSILSKRSIPLSKKSLKLHWMISAQNYLCQLFATLKFLSCQSILRWWTPLLWPWTHCRQKISASWEFFQRFLPCVYIWLSWGPHWN